MNQLARASDAFKFTCAAGAILPGLYLISVYNYLLFHSLAEISSIVIGCCVFAIAWNSRRRLGDGYFLFVGTTLLAASCLDVVHMLAYKGMGVFPGFDADLPTQLWLAARYVQSMGVLVATVYLRRKLQIAPVIAAHLAITVLLLALIFVGGFPACYVEGVGLTPFKIASEYFIAVAFLSSALIMWRRREALDAEVVRWLIAWLLLNVCAELAFTAYVDLYGFAILVGHCFKVIATYAIYRAVVEIGLETPRRLLSKNLRQDQEERMRSEERLRQLANATFEGIAISERGVLVDANAQLCSLLGYQASEMIGRPVLEFVAPESRALVQQKISAGVEAAYEHLLLRKDGSTVQVLSHARYLQWQGRQMRVTAVVDITDLRRAEAQLRKLSRAVEQSPASIVITDREGRIEYVNPRFEEVTGYTREEAIGQNPRLLKSGVTGADVYADLWRSIAAGGEWRGELCNRRKSGELFWEYAAISGLEGDDGGVTHYIAVKNDITERKWAEASLRESEARFSTVFHSNPIGISISRVEDGRILEINDAALRLYGYRREDVIGHTAANLGLYANPEQRGQLIETLRVQGQVDALEIKFRRRIGSIGTLALSAREIKIGKEVCLIAMMLDVTERKRLEEVHLNAQKLESLGTLAGGIAHDFNNILAAIRGNAELAAADLGAKHPVMESLAEIRNASARASELVRRIMAFGRPQPPRRIEADMGEVVDEVLKLLRSTLPAGIALRTHFAHDLPRVLVDVAQVHEVVVNLTTNAAHAIGPRAGAIDYELETVEVGSRQGAGLNLASGRYARLAVKDSGCGMDEATMSRIFDAFYTTKPVGEGTGLGLSMVYGIMHSHGGTVTVESAPGKGSTFHLYFPAAKAEDQPEAKPTAGDMTPRAGQRVMYVDDEESLVLLATRALARFGHGVTGFTDPEAALERFRAHPDDFDVVVTDLSMPEMSGFDLTRALLAIRPDIPVLLTSGYIRTEDERSAHAAGIRELVLKPATTDELAMVLDRLFRGGAPIHM